MSLGNLENWKLDELTPNEAKLTLNLYNTNNTCKISIPQLS